MRAWNRIAGALVLASLGLGFSFIINTRTGLPVKWPSGPVTVRIMLGSSPTLSDGSDYSASVQTATQIWNGLIGAMQFQPQIGAPGSPGDGNNINELAFASTVFGRAFDANTLAVTTTWRSGNERLEADTIFNTAWTWDSYRGPRRTGRIDIQRVAIHELGHTLGLDHPDEAVPVQTIAAIMNSHIGDIDAPTSDDIAGAQKLYGPPGRPANDNFANAATFTLSNIPTAATGYNTNASKETGEPSHAGNSGGRSVWWKFTAPSDGSIILDTKGSIFDTTLGVYTGPALSALTAIASNDDVNPGVIQYSTVTFNTMGGTTYYFAVDGFDGDSGSLNLNLSFTPGDNVPPIITSQPVSQTATPGGSASFTVEAIGRSLSYQWFLGSSPIGGAAGASLALDNVQAANAGSYSVRVTNSVGSVTSSTATLTILSSPLINQTVTTGHDVIYSVAGASGSFQWQVSADSGATWTNLANNGTYSGVTTSALTITGATSALNGSRYRYVATSSGGISTSNAATLTVAAAFFPRPVALTVDGSGILYVCDSSTQTVQKVSTPGEITLLAGTANTAGSADGTGAAARFNQPGGITVATDGTVTVADTANSTLRRITAAGTVTTFAGSATNRGNTDGAGTAATFSAPVGLAQNSGGSFYVADSMNHTVRRISPAAVVTTFAGSAGQAGTADGTGAAARFNFPTGAAADGSGNVYIADTTNNTIRKITPGGVVTTLAGLAGVSGMVDGSGNVALFNRPGGLAVDASGNLYVADTGNSTIRKITPAGAVTTLAGLPTIAGLKDGTGMDAFFNQPQAVALDGSGNVYVADTGNAAIRKVTPSGGVTTLALTQAAVIPPPIPTPTPTPTPTPAPSGGGGGGAPSLWFCGALSLLILARIIFRRLS